MRFTERIDFNKTAPKLTGGTGLRTTYCGNTPVCYWGIPPQGSIFSFLLLPLTIPGNFRHLYCTRNNAGTLVFSSTDVLRETPFQMMMMVDIKKEATLENLATRALQTAAMKRAYKVASIEPIHEQYENHKIQRIIEGGGVPPVTPGTSIPKSLKGCIGSLFDNGALHYFLVNEGTPEQYYMIPIVFPSMFIGYYRYSGDFIHKVIEVMAEFNTETTTGVRSFPFEITPPDDLVLSEPLAGIVYVDDLTYPSKNAFRRETVQVSFNSLTNETPPTPDLNYA
jgi:hypothetical protein